MGLEACPAPASSLKLAIVPKGKEGWGGGLKKGPFEGRGRQGGETQVTEP